MAKIVKLNESILKKMILKEISDTLGLGKTGDSEQTITPNRISRKLEQLLTRYEISDLLEELQDNQVSRSRIREIIRFFKENLGDGPYYCIDFDRAKKGGISVRIKVVSRDRESPDYLKAVRLDKNFKAYTSNTSYSMKAGYGKIENGPEFPIVIEEVYPKTAYEFYRFDDYTKYYVNSDFLNEYNIEDENGEELS